MITRESEKHDCRASALRRLAYLLRRAGEDCRLFQGQTIPAEAKDCIAKARDLLATARDHVELEAQGHEREALRLEREG